MAPVEGTSPMGAADPDVGRTTRPRPVPAEVLLHLVGPLSVERGGRELTLAEVGSRKGRPLLRLLCARRGEVLSCAEIAAVLWPGALPADPDAVIASLASRLRRVLGPDAVLGSREGYRIGAVETDVHRSRRLLEDAERETSALAAASAHAALLLLEAGDALPEEAGAEWTAPVRSEVTALRRRGRHLLARASLEEGDLSAAQQTARRALDEDPLDEAAARPLMTPLRAGGLRAVGLRVCEGLRAALADELGADPGDASRQLHAAALRGRLPGDADAGRPRAVDRLGLAGREAEVAVLRAAWERACRR